MQPLRMPVIIGKPFRCRLGYFLPRFEKVHGELKQQVPIFHRNAGNFFSLPNRTL